METGTWERLIRRLKEWNAHPENIKTDIGEQGNGKWDTGKRDGDWEEAKRS